MPYFGAHMSIAGGVTEALLAAGRFNCQTVQLFTKNPSQWKGKELTLDEIQLFQQTLKRLKLRYPTAHDSYLINLASPDVELYRKSIEAFVDEMNRAERLGLKYLVTHPGAHLDTGEDQGILRIVRAIDEIHKRCSDYRVEILLEITAGQGTTLGHRFEHLGQIIQQIQEPNRLGVCFDTCHVLAAGYDFTHREGYLQTIEEFDRQIGLKKLKLFHLNDSKKPLGSRVDRHEHLGKGFVGLEPFRWIVNDHRFRAKPMILETPKESEENDTMDEVNFAVLHGLIDSE
jgi:deoxyribonuclease IV